MQIIKGVTKVPTVCTLFISKEGNDDDNNNNNNNNNNIARSVLGARLESMVQHSLHKDPLHVSPQSQNINVVTGVVEEKNWKADLQQSRDIIKHLTLRLLMSYIYKAPSKARNADVVYIWTYVWQR